jgi:hypothetical protein
LSSAAETACRGLAEAIGHRSAESDCAEPYEKPVEEVMVIFEALADIKKNTLDILAMLEQEDDDEP